MRVLIVSDTPRDGWAIGKLSDAIIKYTPHIEMDFVAVHPKEIDRDIVKFKEALDKQPDVIHFQYWRTTQQLFERMPELKKYKTIQTHHNQKNTLSVNWKELNINVHIVHTDKNKQKLQVATYDNVYIIQHGIDLDYFTYNENYGNETYVGYVGRIVPWKGLKEIAWATNQNDLKVLGMGKMDKPKYWAEIPLKDKNIIDFTYNNIKDSERIDAYREMMCFVGNSRDNREEGTLPLLEAMATGVPVITTLSGEAADIISDGENGLVIPFENKEALKVKIKMLKDDKELREKLRKKAWQTIKNFTEEKMARQYAKLYIELNNLNSEEMVSVITPCYNNLEQLKEMYLALEEQTYPVAEWIICDDNSDENIGQFALKLRNKASFAIKYINTLKDGYNLAMARNMGIIEAVGKYLWFIDGRIKPEKNALNEFMIRFDEKLKGGKEVRKNWLFGNKGGNKKHFVENFSLVKRSRLIKAGMFCERINRYGGMSQEIRERWQSQGNKVKYCPSAQAEQVKGSHLTNKRRADIIKSKLKLYKMGL